MKIKRTIVTETCIGIYSKQNVCLLKEHDDKDYTLYELPKYMVESEEEGYHLKKEDEIIWYTKQEKVQIGLAIIIPLFCLTLFAFFSDNFNLPLTKRTIVGIYYLILAGYFILLYDFLIGKIKKERKDGKVKAKWQGALNQVINAFERKGEIPTIEEVKDSLLYFGTRQRDWKPTDYIVVIFLLTGLSFFTPNFLLQVITIPAFVILGIVIVKHYFWGLLRITYVSKPTEYEIERVLELLKFWHSVSYSKSPNNTK